MSNIKICKLWLTAGICSFLSSTISFISKSYIDSVAMFLLSISCLGLALALATSNINENIKSAINKFVGSFITPLSITFLGALVYG